MGSANLAAPRIYRRAAGWAGTLLGRGRQTVANVLPLEVTEEVIEAARRPDQVFLLLLRLRGRGLGRRVCDRRCRGSSGTAASGEAPGALSMTAAVSWPLSLATMAKKLLTSLTKAGRP
jgi:hypothetical protein